MTASERGYPFNHQATHPDWQPELDPDLLAERAPFDYQHQIVANPYRLDEAGYIESDHRVPTQAERDRAMKEFLGLHRAVDISHQIGSGTSAEAILAAEEARLRRLAGIEDPMGPDLDTPNF